MVFGISESDKKHIWEKIAEITSTKKIQSNILNELQSKYPRSKNVVLTSPYKGVLS